MQGKARKTQLLSRNQSADETESGGQRQYVQVLDPANGLHAPDGAVHDGSQQKQSKPAFCQADMDAIEWFTPTCSPALWLIGDNFRQPFNCCILHCHYLSRVWRVSGLRSSISDN